MAKSMKGATGFSQMPKMMTDEPSVILKLKKGGHVSMKHKKEEHGHKTMEHHAMGGMSGMPMARPMGMAPAMAGAAPMKPSLAMRRKAMATPLMKKGGKAKHHAEGGDIAQDKALIKKAFKEHDAQEHKGGKGTKLHLKHGGKAHHKFAKGGKVDGGNEIDRFETKTTIENDEKPFVRTKVVGAGKDTAHGTGMVKEGNAGGYKRGGKVHHVSGHPEGSHEHHKHMAKHHAKMHKEGGSIHHKKMAEHHKAMCMGGKYASGGAIGSRVPSETNESETRGKTIMGGTIEGNEGYYENTEMHSAAKDSARGTGGVSMSNAGGFKRGGKAHHKHHYAKGGMVDLEGTIEGNEGRFANNNVDTTPRGKTHTKTGEVKEANAGGFKRGGHAAKKGLAKGGFASIAPLGEYAQDAQAEMNAMRKGGSSKKHYATGGSVNRQGAAKEMPQARKPASKPTHINELSGVFKKGGRVKKFSGEDGSAVTSDPIINRENARRQAELNTTKYENEHPFGTMYKNIKDLVMGPSSTPPNSVTKTKESVTVAKRRGGSIKR